MPCARRSGRSRRGLIVPFPAPAVARADNPLAADAVAPPLFRPALPVRRQGRADIALFLAQFYGERKGAVLMHATPRLMTWRERVLARPAVSHVVGRMGAWLASQGRPVPGYVAGIVPG